MKMNINKKKKIKIKEKGLVFSRIYYVHDFHLLRSTKVQDRKNMKRSRKLRRLSLCGKLRGLTLE